MPAMITAQPSQARPPSRSPASVKPKNAAQTGSSENTSAVCVARRAPLRPGLREERERAREDAGDEQRAPHRPAVRHCELAGRRSRSTSRPAQAAEHLDEREGERVVARREPLHQDDLQRVDRGAGEHEQVASDGRRVHAAREQQRARPSRAATPTQAARGDADPEEQRARVSGVSTTYIPVMKPGRRDGRPLEPGRLQGVAGAEQRAGERSRRRARAARAPRSAAQRRAERARSSRSRSAARGTRTAGYSATASLTWTNVTPQTAVTATSTIRARTREIKRCLTPGGVGHRVAGTGSYGSQVRRARHLRPPAPRPADLGHRPLQLPLRLLHAEGGLRARPSVPRAARAPDVRGDRPRRARLRRAAACRSSASRAASRSCGATSSSLIAHARRARRRSDADDERLAAAAEGAGCSRTPASAGSRSASTRSTTRSSAR